MVSQANKQQLWSNIAFAFDDKHYFKSTKNIVNIYFKNTIQFCYMNIFKYKGLIIEILCLCIYFVCLFDFKQFSKTKSIGLSYHIIKCYTVIKKVEKL